MSFLYRGLKAQEGRAVSTFGFRPLSSAFRFPLSAFSSVVCMVVVWAAPPTIGKEPGKPTFEEQRKAVAVSPGTQPEETILSLLQTGIAEGKPTQAIALAREWLRQNNPESPMLLYHAGRAAEQSGDWKSAVSLYRQYVKKADLQSTSADNAVVAVYTLLIDYLRDVEGAYAFGRNEGHRLLVCPRAKQFDQWFLDMALARRDREAVARRLLGCVKGGLGDDLLIARYEKYFRWLLDSIRGARYDVERFSPKFCEDVKALAAAIAFDEELKLLLDWAVSVKQYNMAMLDGEEAAAPVAAAGALLARYPRHALLVQTDWAGGSRSQYYRGDPNEYWPKGLAAKTAPVRAAMVKLTPLEQVDLLSSWGSRYYSGGPQVLSGEEARAFLLANPKLVNRKAIGPWPQLWDEQMPIEELQKLAPHLSQNATPEAFYIRAFAAAGERDYEKVKSSLLGPENWRLGESELRGTYADRIWHYCGRPGDNKVRDAGIAKSKEIAETIKAGDVKNDAPAAARMAAFKKLWADFRSPTPKIPAVCSRLAKVLQMTPEGVPELLADRSVEAQMLVRDALAKGFDGPDGPLTGDPNVRGLSPSRYDPAFIRLKNRHRNDINYLKSRDLYRPHPLEPALRKAVADRLKRNEAESWLTIAWINAQFPEDNEESVKLMESLLKSPLYKKLSSEARYAARSWFSRTVMTPAQLAYVDAVDEKLISRELSALPEDADVDATAAAIRAVIERVEQAPSRASVVGLENLTRLDEEVFKDPKVLDPAFRLAALTAPQLYETSAYQLFSNRLIACVAEEKAYGLLHEHAAPFWLMTSAYHRSLPSLLQMGQAALETNPSAATALANTGLETIATHTHGHTYYTPDDIESLKRIRSRAAIAMGLVDIPVPKNHPDYPIYKSQSEFVGSNLRSAWELYEANADRLLPMHRKLSVSYLVWLLRRNIDVRDQQRQESLVKALQQWAAESTTAFTPEQRVELDIAYGDIAMQRGMLPEAREIFRRIQENEEYDGLLVQHKGTLRRIMVERLSKDFDQALKTIAELEMQRIPSVTTEAMFARAEVYYDMEEYEDAAEEIEAVLQRSQRHEGAILLRGRVQIHLKKLMEATEVEVVAASSQSTLVPGEVLKVTLNDPTLSVSAGGTEIEAVIWATSGDKEYVLLRQFGDERTKYRGEVKTALGAPEPHDRILQVLGDDQVFYAFSERFRKKMSDLPENRGGPIGVASDAMLMASARKLLTPAEQRIADMQYMAEAFEARRLSAAARRDPLVMAQMKAETEKAAERRRLAARAKPGSPIHVRVIDPDLGRTAEIDEAVVSVHASSGDSIGQIILKETATHSGTFEGSVPTTGAQAMAFASSSAPPSNPNMVISPKTDYPAWTPVPSKDEAYSFTIDLNDNVPIGQMRIRSAEPGNKLTSFVVKTGMNRRDLITIARYPAAQLGVKPWLPSVTVVGQPYENDRRARDITVEDLRALATFIDRDWAGDAARQGVAKNVSGPSQALPEWVPAARKWLRQGRFDNPLVIARFRAYFYEAENVTRRFGLTLGRHKAERPVEFALAVDGRALGTEENKLEGELNLRAGVHTLEIWATGYIDDIGFGRTVTLKANIEDETRMIECPERMFDPAGFPEGSLSHANNPATATADQDGTEFTIDFAPNSRTRLLQIEFVSQEGPLPALNRVTLEKPGGDRVLPVAVDFAELRKNDVLEILTGDKVTVRYVDERYVTQGKAKHERFLGVAYTTAKVEFADIDPRPGRGGELQPYHERILRFQHGVPLPIVIHDADMDVSVDADTIEYTLVSSSGDRRVLTAKETGPSTGVFRTLVTPIDEPTKDADKIVVDAAGRLTVTYRDAENTNPGVATDRVATIEHAAFATPIIMPAHMTVAPIEPGDDTRPQRLVAGFMPAYYALRNPQRRISGESIVPRFRIDRTYLSPSNRTAEGLSLVHGRHAIIDIAAPHLALRTLSTVTLYAQTDTGRRQAGWKPTADVPFDITVPGTWPIEAVLGKIERSGVPQIAGYIDGPAAGSIPLSQRADRGRFQAVLPLVAGATPRRSFAVEEPRPQTRREEPTHGLVVRPGERIHLGMSYKDAKGKTRWATASARVITNPILDVMCEGYRGSMKTAFVGEKVYLRVVDLGADTSDEPDSLKVFMAAKSGAKQYAELRETEPHSGIFRGSYRLSLKPSAVSSEPEKDSTAKAQTSKLIAQTSQLPVLYGDTLGVRYTDASGFKTPAHYVTINKGSDGRIEPFSKRYTDQETADRTQFALAESYLELARRHRKLGQTKVADLGFARAKQLLAGAMGRFHDPAARARAEYLLGGLTEAQADTTSDRQLRQDRYHAALARYMKITGSYPDTIYASRAQFKIALIYERLSEPEIAAQEYVKLAYKYPDSEHLATAMARLGTHFQRKATAYEKRAAPLLAQKDDPDAQHEAAALKQMAAQEYIKSAQIFGRLQQRFPDHELAGRAGLMSGKTYLRAGRTEDAVTALRRIIDTESYDGKTLRAEAMYWAAKCHQSTGDQMSAYALYKRITYDFPESKWAAYARGQLAQDVLLQLDKKLELQRLEEGQ